MNKKLIDINNNEVFIDLKKIKSIHPFKQKNKINTIITLENGNRFVFPTPPLLFYKKIK